MAKKSVVARKTYNTIKKINSYSTPLLGVVSAAAPAFAPAAGVAKAVLSAGEALSKNFV